MTIKRDTRRSRGSHGDQPSQDARRQIAKAGPVRGGDDERHGLWVLAGRVMATPGAMVRALIFIGVLLALILVAAGIFQLRVDVGPMHVGPAVTSHGM